MKKSLIMMAAAMLPALTVSAKVVLPDILGSNMVLQQKSEVRLWGHAAPDSGVDITSSWGAAAHAQSGADGYWETAIATPAATYEPQTLTFADGTGDNTELGNLLVGEVWFCSGQSNMEMPLEGFWNCPVEGANETIATAAQYKGIRVATVRLTGAMTPQENVEVEWRISTPDNAQWFSATAYYFARMLNESLDIPVGIVVCAWGGTRVEGWLPREIVEQYPDIDLAKSLRQNPDGSWHWETPVAMYNGMAHPLRKLTVKGFLWYQGESNVGRAATYAERLKTMVERWRDDRGSHDLPFYMVELAPFVYGGDGTSGARLREAQHRAAEIIPNSGIVCTNDLIYPFERHQIHPCRKQEVGYRLAYLALNRTYGFSGIVCDGAKFREMRTEGGSAELFFDNAEAGFSPWDDISGFEIAGADRVFHPAKARLNPDRKTIIVSCGEVAEPAAVRYCFRDFQVGNLTGRRGLPVAPFRTDDWD